MKKWLKYGILSVVFILVALVALVRAPFVQKKIVKRVLQCYLGDVSIGKVSIGLSGGKLEKFSFCKKNIQFNLNRCAVRWSLGSLIHTRKWVIEDLKLQGVLLDILPEDSSKEGTNVKIDLGEHQAGNVIFDTQKILKIGEGIGAVGYFVNNPQLPFPITLNRAEVEGVVNMQDKATASFSVKCRGLRPDGKAQLEYVSVVNMNTDAEPWSVCLEGDAGCWQDDTGHLSDLCLRSKCRFYDQEGYEKKTLFFDGSISHDQEVNHVFVKAEDPDDQQFKCDFEVKYNDTTKVSSINMDVDFSLSSFACLFPQKVLNPFEVRAEADGEFDFNHYQGMVKTSLDINLSHEWANKIMPSLASDVRLSGDAAFEWKNNRLAMKDLACVINSSDDSLKILISGLNPLLIWERYGGFDLEKSFLGSSGKMFRIFIEGFNPKFLLASDMPIEAQGMVSAELEIDALNGSLILKTVDNSRLNIADLVLTYDDNCVIDHGDFDVGLDLSFGKTNRIKIKDFSLRVSDNDYLLSGALELGVDDQTQHFFGSGGCVLKIGELKKVPMVSEVVSAEVKNDLQSEDELLDYLRGSLVLEGKVDAYGHHRLTIDGRCGAKSIVLEPNAVPLSFEGDFNFVKDQNECKLNFPFSSEGEKFSSVMLSLKTFLNEKGRIDGTAELRGDSLSLYEFLRLKGVIDKLKNKWSHKPFAHSKFGPKTAPKEPLDIYQPWWPSFDLHFKTTLDAIHLSKNLSIDHCKGALVVSEDKIDFRGGYCSIKGTPIKANASLFYRNQEDDVYALKGTCECYCKDASKLTSVLEGEGVLSANVYSQGATFTKLIRDMNGAFDLRLSNGYFNTMQLLDNKTHFLLSAVGTLAYLLNDGQQDTAVSHSLALSGLLSHLPYTKARIFLERKDAKDIVLQDVSAVGPEFDVKATGKIKSGQTTFFMDSPVDVVLNIVSYGELGTALEGLHVARPNRSNGYVCNPIRLRGTLAHLEYSEFQKFISLIQSALKGR